MRSLLVISVLMLVGCSQPSESVTKVDLLISGGLVYDGSGSVPIVTDVAVDDGRIVFIGDAAAEGIGSDDVVDADGLWVAPGFVDAHSHAVLDEDYGRDAIPFLKQGITTVVLGMDGIGTSDVQERLDAWDENGIGVNGIHFVGHGYVRNAVMGHEDRAPSDDELEAMRQLVRKGMQEGAFGLSTGLFYVPGTYASTEEVIELGKVAAEFDNAIYDTHDRDLGAVYQGVGYEASVREAIRITEEAGLRGIFSHYNLQGAHNYGRAELGAKLINDARPHRISPLPNLNSQRHWLFRPGRFRFRCQ